MPVVPFAWSNGASIAGDARVGRRCHHVRQHHPMTRISPIASGQTIAVDSGMTTIWCSDSLSGSERRLLDRVA
jgi:hypothetical protein